MGILALPLLLILAEGLPRQLEHNDKSLHVQEG
jgi:hypothetical protein